MKRRNALPALTFLILAVIVASTQSSSAVGPDHGPLAFGEGEFEFVNDFGTEQWSYSFEVMSNKNDKATGRAIFDIVESNIQTQVVVKINCLSVGGPTGAATAIMSGTVLHSDDPEFPKRANVIFGAEDNSAFFPPVVRPDHITRPFVFSGDCHASSFPFAIFAQSPDAIHIEQR